MSIKKYKPTTSSRRFMSVVLYKKTLTKSNPEKSLTTSLNRKSGRSKGRVSVRHKGGGVKRLYRLIDFRQNKLDIKGKIKSIEYDPNRSAFIALVVYADGEKRYILAPDKIKVGDEIQTSTSKIVLNKGNRMPLQFIPTGTPVHNVELIPKKGGEIAKTAGSAAFVTGVEEKYAHVKLPSGEVRKIDKSAFASVGAVSNPEYNRQVIGKAGRVRWKSIRPTVRGKAMPPSAHPHGGGEGRSPVGLKHPKTPWGKPAKGVKTRKRKASDKLIVKRRKEK